MSESNHRVLVVGGGSIGERHVRCFQKTGRAELMLCEIDAATRGRVGETYGLSFTSDDLTAALAERPDLVVVCTPAHLHISQGRQVAEAGAHLLLEKPLSVSEEGVAELISLIADRELYAGVAYVYRAHPVLGEIRETVRSNRFGRPLQVSVQSGQHFPHYRPAYRETYYTRHETGGGAIQDALTHLVNAVEWIVGRTTAVAADAAHLLLDGVDVEDTVNALARNGDVMTSYSMNQHQAANETRISVVCENGTLLYEGHRHRWAIATEPGEEWREQSRFEFERDDLFVIQANQTLDAIEGKMKAACTLDEARQTLRVNRALLTAARDRCWVEIPSD
ncbi:MAG: gfo/Idh/MocA family oxidoreductase [Planctomycetota bacterium]|nr:MAG: gfo/Idh/MocA family oxidoreductase [Planctomycetota bacterium]REK24273.1 MAG: gfo/Idh/MocA family oxidoreductase [Planctomycetota bacterium]REK28742.1 MAG: gfo/Idh/MocA family oxidoreductase [Planctomycetota bacterium]